jgi:hypothetical protein
VTAGAAVSDGAGAVPPGTTVLTAQAGTVTISASPTGSSSSDTLTFVDNPNQTYSSGHPGHFTATVAVVLPATGVPSGTISWSVTSATDTSVACSAGDTVKVSKMTGSASCIVPPGVLTAAGAPYQVEAIYSGDTNFMAGSGTFSQALNPANTKTYLAASPNPPIHDKPAVLSAAVVTSKFGGPPTGGMTFTFTSLPFKVAGCATTSGSATLHCPGGLSGVGVGYGVTDVSSGMTLVTGTTVTATTATTATLSHAAGGTTSNQTILFTPNTSPTISCSGGNTVAVSGGDATCSVSGGFPLVGSPFGVVATYSGDSSDAGTSSHQLKLTAR